MSLRTVLVLLILVLVAYAIVQARRAVAARRAARRAAVPAAPERNEPVEDDGDDDEEIDEAGFNYAPRPAVTSAPAAPVAASATAESAAAVAERFKLELELRQLRGDLTRLQSEQTMQRQVIDDLVDSVRTLREQLEANLSGQGVSPEYDEALVFARRGLDAEAIAERCGITVAEAELVRSMTQRGAGQEDA
ncbi:DUF2802 domain-containing protein [Pseudothauera nasutitermitis]|nr:DUF2802 domain-containing protein [Pseudothauera nasutitermitis]